MMHWSKLTLLVEPSGPGTLEVVDSTTEARFDGVNAEDVPSARLGPDRV